MVLQVQMVELGIHPSLLGQGLRVEGLGFRVEGLGFRV